MSRASSPLLDRMIFLVGARRSGTNWLQRILCARPDVAATPSETYLFHGVAQLTERFHHAAPSSPTTGLVYMDRDGMLDALRDLCDAVFQGILETTAPTSVRLVERTPDHVRHLRLIGQVYPDARFLHIIRDGRDVVRSLLSQDWGPDSVEEAAEEWRSAIAAARAAAPLLLHYREVRYEQLLTEPGRLASELFDWLGLNEGTDSVEAAVAEASVQFNVDPRAPRVGADKWRETLSEHDVAAFMRIAGSTLAELGYTEDPATTGADGRAGRHSAPERLAGTVARWRSRRRGRFEREANSRARQAQYVLDQVLACMSSRDIDRLVGLLDPSGFVRIVDPGFEWDGRGSAGRDRLIEYLSADPALKGRMVRGDVHPSIPTVTALLAYQLPDGSTADRLMSATIDAGRVVRLTYYRLPLRAADGFR